MPSNHISMFRMLLNSMRTVYFKVEDFPNKLFLLGGFSPDCKYDIDHIPVQNVLTFYKLTLENVCFCSVPLMADVWGHKEFRKNTI